ncbi:uncharacterized protein B0I36DRAFT_336024 [Microdochium trichocladiopsis]|uniref:Uncharacterized protein n=1 Tax=Microdochium trichocladiopsis TaxID=1682393 RepID=A0A9P8XUQ6_9PEZI|nr:uncharacterized protein B0I36DRAFT_336024 [Microdochium trichocladiopsis]KAH7018474.1 hypothetical protein B0I36DRAFT_336024 [Microdochium trichocladiopsis]
MGPFRKSLSKTSSHHKRPKRPSYCSTASDDAWNSTIALGCTPRGTGSWWARHPINSALAGLVLIRTVLDSRRPGRCCFSYANAG